MPVLASHRSMVQLLPSSHTSPSLCTQPMSGSQLSTVQALPSPQSTNSPLHSPSSQLLLAVHLEPSSQGPPLFREVIWHRALAGLQMFFRHSVSFFLVQKMAEFGFSTHLGAPLVLSQ